MSYSFMTQNAINQCPQKKSDKILNSTFELIFTRPLLGVKSIYTIITNTH